MAIVNLIALCTRICIAGLSGIVCASCATVRMADRASVALHPHASAGGSSLPPYEGSGDENGVGVPARGFLNADDFPRNGYGAYGYCLLVSRANDKNRERYCKVASVFRDTLEVEEGFVRLPIDQIMPTFWFLNVLPEKVDEVIHQPDCSSMVEHYDYARAKVLISKFDVHSSMGPILVASRVQLETTGSTSEALIFDLSNFADDDLDRAFRIWSARIVKDPERWNKGFALEKFREDLRSLFEKYGQQIVAELRPALDRN